MKLIDTYTDKEYIVEDDIELEEALKEIFDTEGQPAETVAEVAAVIENYAYARWHGGVFCGYGAYLGEGDFFKIVED